MSNYSRPVQSASRGTARRWLVLAAVVIVGLLAADAVWACPTCKENLANSGPQAGNLIRGYFWSIVFMMSMPFLILGGLSTYFFYEVRKARARQASGEAAFSGQTQLPAY